MKHKLTLQLRGERNYVQATSIFDSIISIRQAKSLNPTEIDFSMRRFTNKNCYLIINNNDTFNDEDIIGEYRDIYGNITILESQHPVVERVAYNESTIVNQCSIHENTIKVPPEISSFSFIEKTIAAYKALLQKNFGKSGIFFFFIRLTLDHIPQGGIQIIYDRRISKKYYQGTIRANLIKVGMIYFGVNKI